MYTPQQVTTAIDMYQMGCHIDDIANEIGKPLRSIRSKLIREGVYVSKPIPNPEFKEIWFSHNPKIHGKILYIVQCGEFFKIGITSRTVEKRIAHMKTGNPFPIDIVWESQRNELVSVLEREYHQILKDRGKHHEGEWFNLSINDIENIQRWVAEDIALHSENRFPWHFRHPRNPTRHYDISAA